MIAVDWQHQVNASFLLIILYPSLNHDTYMIQQYDKSWAFEKQACAYIKEYTSPDIHYFSALQHVGELHIASYLARACDPRYLTVFVSCNEVSFVLFRRSGRTKVCSSSQPVSDSKHIHLPFMYVIGGRRGTKMVSSMRKMSFCLPSLQCRSSP